MDTDESPAPIPLNTIEVRIVGCLIEKELTLPEYYPLTLNALVNACNQTTNRDPVMNLGESAVSDALHGLKQRGFVFQVTMAGARVQKFKHNLQGKYPRLEKPGMALLAVLLLRGIQTLGELRQRTERMQPFPDLESVEAELQKLIDYPEGPLVACLPAGSGRRVAAYAHLLSGEPVIESPPVVVVAPRTEEAIDPAWKERMETEVAALKEEIARLKAHIGLED